MDNEKKKEIGYALAKAGFGSIPVVGAAASELLQLLVTPPIEKRRTDWMNQIGVRLKDLEDKKLLALESLPENEKFIDVVLQTTQEAIKTSEKEKIEYFRNAILNTAVGLNPDSSEIQIFLKFVSDFTVWHIKILKLFNDPKEWFEKNEKEIPNYMSSGLSSILSLAYPELKGRREFYDLIWDDLHRAGLHKTSGLHVSMTGSGLMVPRTTEFGKSFLKFITESPTE
ncbi:hypothetical protein [Maribacter spongiicola]|uniref:hypothetical protein n=1 Tax=Maribacter spongiicola TaxID=1206753 RepID=UPI003F9692B5